MSTTSPAEHPLSRQLLQHEGFVRHLAARLVGDSVAAEDVAQDALTLALQRGPRGRNGLRAWLSGTVRTRLHRAHEKLRDRLIAAHGGDRRAWLAAFAPFFVGQRIETPSASAAVGVATAPIPAAALLGALVVAAGVGFGALLSATGTDPAPPAPVIDEPIAASTVAPPRQEGEDPAQQTRQPIAEAAASEREVRESAYWEAVRKARSKIERLEDAVPESPRDAALRRAVREAIVPPLTISAQTDLRAVMERLGALLKLPTAVTTWELEGVFVEIDRKAMTVHNSREVHETIETRLEQLRGFLIPLPEEGRPGVSTQLGASAADRRVVDYLTRTTIASLFEVNAAGVHVGDLLERAGAAGSFGFVRLGGADAVVVPSPGGATTLASGLDALREQGVSWTSCHGIVVVWSGHSHAALQAIALRDVRDILTRVEVPAPRLVGHPALERWAAEADTPFLLTADCIARVIYESIDPGSWDQDPSNTLSIGEEVLVLAQSPAVVAEVDGLLEALLFLAE